MRFKRLLAAMLLLCTVLTVLPLKADAAGQVYYHIDFSADVMKSRITQKNSSDCALVSLCTVEAYLNGATSGADKTTVYNAVIAKNLGTTSGVPRDNAVQSWGALGWYTDSYSLQKLYNQLATGFPVLVKRRYYDSEGEERPHWSVVCGYVGSTTKLEESGFIVVEISAANTYSGNKCKMTLTQWKNVHSGTSLVGIAYRKGGVPMTNLPAGIRMAVNVPKVIHPYGEGHGVYGYISSNTNLTNVQVRIIRVKTGELVYNINKTPNAKSYNVFNLDSTFQFKALPKGEYYYTVWAKDSAGNTKLVRKYFIVDSSWPAAMPSEPVYTVQYDANGGTGTAPASQRLKFQDASFTIAENTFTRPGYRFLGWSVQRTPDNKWFAFTDSDGNWAWLTDSQLQSQGLTARVYEPGYSTQITWPWIKDCGYLSPTLTFYAQWEKDGSIDDTDQDWEAGDDWVQVECQSGHTWNGGELYDADSILYTCEVCGHTYLETRNGTFRLAGENRFETAFDIAVEMENYVEKKVETDGVDTKFVSYDTVIIASGTNFADALAGSYLASVKEAPILLSYNEHYNDLAKEYIRRNLISGGTVYILGGEAAVPASMEEGLEDYNVVRLAGANRFETNLAILMEAGVGQKEILVCTGTNFADSLSASATGLPILLVYNESGKLTLEQKKYLSFLEGNKFTIIGGENAVSTQLENALGTYGSTSRLAGANRFETSVKIARTYFSSPDSVILAYAWNYPDGLCGGPLAYSMEVPLILTMDGYEAQAAGYVREQELGSGIVLGGSTLISDNTVRAIFDLAADAEITVK